MKKKCDGCSICQIPVARLLSCSVSPKITHPILTSIGVFKRKIFNGCFWMRTQNFAGIQLFQCWVISAHTTLYQDTDSHPFRGVHSFLNLGGLAVST